jgi:hypothetical protein
MKVLEIAHVNKEERTASNGNKFITVHTKATKVNGVITPSRRICVFDDFDLYEVGDKIEVE